MRRFTVEMGRSDPLDRRQDHHYPNSRRQLPVVQRARRVQKKMITILLRRDRCGDSMSENGMHQGRRAICSAAVNAKASLLDRAGAAHRAPPLSTVLDLARQRFKTPIHDEAYVDSPRKRRLTASLLVSPVLEYVEDGGWERTNLQQGKWPPAAVDTLHDRAVIRQKGSGTCLLPYPYETLIHLRQSSAVVFGRIRNVARQYRAAQHHSGLHIMDPSTT